MEQELQAKLVFLIALFVSIFVYELIFKNEIVSFCHEDSKGSQSKRNKMLITTFNLTLLNFILDGET